MNPKKTKSSGILEINPRNMERNDLVEAVYMLEAAATLLRQSFGIVNAMNALLSNPMSTSELKEFGKHFDIVHSTCRLVSAEVNQFIAKNRPLDNVKS